MTALSLPRRLGVGGLPLAIAGAIGAVALGLICGRVAVSHYGKIAIEAIILAPILLAVAQRPVVAVIAMLAVVSSVFTYGSLPRVNLPGHPPINVADLFLAAAVGGTVWRRPWRHWPPVARSYALAMLLMVALASVATVKTSLLGSAEAREALYYLRDLLYLAIALTIAIELNGDLWRPLLLGLIAFAAAVSVVSIAAAASHSVAHEVSVLAPTSIMSASADAGSPTARIRLPGLYFVYAMLIPTLVLILLERSRRPRVLLGLALLLMLGAIGVSLNRNMYVGALVGLIITAVLGGPRLRFRIGLVGVAMVVALTLVVITSVAPAITAQIGKRASTALAPSQIVSSGSFQDRTYELSFALPAIGRHPWFGVGPRQAYGALLDPFTDRPRFFVQNLYVDLATDYGIPMALAFLLVPGVCLMFGLRRLRQAADSFDRAMVAAMIGTLVALLLSLVVGTYLQDPDSTAAFGVACGLLLATALRTTTYATMRTSMFESEAENVRPA